ncbi:hypothetical protein BCR36DRAFT_83686 [Piromyces finnis]|uniref:Uncharacterized protein n=1 Tax=Piromyces finnis TaxID=1754191 RepID=A0A1Y1V693_9FUNG|nr:hypothetical protein BCR36DRAFT_83686 [Piromyces finnis]|eukprot:ORX48169.1 hypothetical protein BCR36DRAFT_83686 [Piromyces finnis]
MSKNQEINGEFVDIKKSENNIHISMDTNINNDEGRNNNYFFVFLMKNGDYFVTQLFTNRTDKQIFRRSDCYLNNLYEEKEEYKNATYYYLKYILDENGDLRDKFHFPILLYKFDEVIIKKIKNINNNSFIEAINIINELLKIIEKKKKQIKEKKNKIKAKRNNSNKLSLNTPKSESESDTDNNSNTVITNAKQKNKRKAETENPYQSLPPTPNSESEDYMSDYSSISTTDDKQSKNFPNRNNNLSKKQKTENIYNDKFMNDPAISNELSLGYDNIIKPTNAKLPTQREIEDNIDKDVRKNGFYNS